MTRTLLRSGLHETVGDIFEQISTTMPQANPGGLSAGDYADILAFIFRLSDYPTGEEELPADLSLLKSMRIEAPRPTDPRTSQKAYQESDQLPVLARPGARYPRRMSR